MDSKEETREEIWEDVTETDHTLTRRLKVPGGWLYSYQFYFSTNNVAPDYITTTFVPEVAE